MCNFCQSKFSCFFCTGLYNRCKSAAPIKVSDGADPPPPQAMLLLSGKYGIFSVMSS